MGDAPGAMPESPLSKKVGARIRALRNAAGLTQAQVAEGTGLAIETISRVESGQNMTLQAAASIAAALHTPLAALFEEGEAPRPELSPADMRILSLLRGLDESTKDDVYTALRALVSVRNPVERRPAKKRSRPT